MSKPKENLFYFDEQQEDPPQVVLQTVSTKSSPSKTVTKQFHKIEDTNQLAKNFFERDNNIDERAKDIIITNSARKKISRKTGLSIPAMELEQRKVEVKHSLGGCVVQNQEMIGGSGLAAQNRDDLEEIQLEGRNIQNKSKKEIEPSEEFQQIVVNCQVFEKHQQKAQQKQQKVLQFEQTIEIQQQKLEKSDSNDENLQTHNQQQQQNTQEPNQPSLDYQAPIKINFSSITDRKTFLTTPIEKGKVLECTLRRDKSGFNHFFPQYYLYTTDGVKYLMTSKKRSGNATSNYLISLDKNDLSTKGSNYIGKLRSNWMGTEFIGYDSGDNPDKIQAGNGKKQRIQLCEIYYQSNFFGSKGPRVMNVYVPKDADPRKQKSSLKQIFDKTGEGFHLINKPPRWNPLTKTFVLNFNNRVDKPSVKNFILIDKQAPSQNNYHYSLLFGRISEDVFNLDVKYPLSPLQAFQIVLSSFDYKLACE